MSEIKLREVAEGVSLEASGIAVEYDGQVLDPRRVRMLRTHQTADAEAVTLTELARHPTAADVQEVEQVERLRRDFEELYRAGTPATILPGGPSFERLEPDKTYVLRLPRVDRWLVEDVSRCWNEVWPEGEPRPRLLIVTESTPLEELPDEALAAAGLLRAERVRSILETEAAGAKTPLMASVFGYLRGAILGGRA